MKVVCVEEDSSVNIREIDETNVPEVCAMLDSGYISAILRINNNKIEYLNVHYNISTHDYGKLEWKESKEVNDNIEDMENVDYDETYTKI